MLRRMERFTVRTLHISPTFRVIWCGRFTMVYTGFGLDPCIPRRRTTIVSARINLGQRAPQISQSDLAAWMDLVQIANWRPKSQLTSHEVGRLIYDERGEFLLRVFLSTFSPPWTYQGQNALLRPPAAAKRYFCKMSTAANVPAPTAHAVLLRSILSFPKHMLRGFGGVIVIRRRTNLQATPRC